MQAYPLKKPIVFWMVLVHVAALSGLFCFSWQAFGVCLLFHFISGGLGITLCYHRLLTHRSFSVPKWLEYFLTLCAALAYQGGPLSWVAAHRKHHAASDLNEDPHSPLHGFFWSHMGWCLTLNNSIEGDEAFRRLVPDLYEDKGHRFLERTHPYWGALAAVGLYAWGGWPFVIWGVFVRLALVYHCTWLVNSASHVWGYQTYKSDDLSRNLWWVALLSYGEGWHNNHHAFQASARHGLARWEPDPTYWMVRLLEKAGLAKAVKLPTAYQLERAAL